ncbi:MAG: SDR family oxidoreductase [Planctomycetota bacterium]
MTRPPSNVLITGASAGIGEAIARRYAGRGDHLIVTARRVDRLESLAVELRGAHGITVTVLPADLAETGAADRLGDRLDEAGLTVDVLVNNAGFGALGHVHTLDAQRQVDMVRVNVGALTELTRRLLPGMVERGRGAVLNVASTAAFQAGPHMAVYYATKAYVVSFTEALAEELRGTGVTATALCPGPTATEFGEAADMADSKLFRLGTMSADRVAAAGVRGAAAGRVIVVPGLSNRLGAVLAKFLPRAATRRLVKRLQQPGSASHAE